MIDDSEWLECLLQYDTSDDSDITVVFSIHTAFHLLLVTFSEYIFKPFITRKMQHKVISYLEYSLNSEFSFS